MNKGHDIFNPDGSLISLTGVLVSRETKNIIDQPIIVRFKDGVVVEYYAKYKPLFNKLHSDLVELCERPKLDFQLN